MLPLSAILFVKHDAVASPSSSMNNNKFTQICWLLLAHEWEMCKTKLSILLYYCQGYHLAFNDAPLFDYPIYALPDGPGFLDEAEAVIDGVLHARDWCRWWLGLGYYWLGYLEYFNAALK